MVCNARGEKMIAQESIDAARKLIALYRRITVEQIEKVEEELGDIGENYYGEKLASEITGFSMPSKCLLCKAVNEDCNKCIYKNGYIGCISDKNMETYQAIKMAKSPEALVYAFNKRADHIQSILNNLEKGE
jgi:hypothetical protein